MLKDKIEREYKNKYKTGYTNRDDYKLAMLFCKILPKIDVSEGFPNFLLTDNFELFYELPATNMFYNDKSVPLTYMDFIETAIKNGTPKNLIFDIFDGIYKINGGYTDLLKPLTKQYYKEYLIKRRAK